MLKFLLDEHIPIAYRPALLQIEGDLEVLRVGDVGAPAFNSLDPDILNWCTENDFALVTNNRKSMPSHLANHIANDQHISGIFVINLDEGIGANAEILTLYATVSLPDEFRDQIIYI